MENIKLRNYQDLIVIDSILNKYTPKYPFNLREQSTYTQHQIMLYQSNYCHTDSEQPQEQPSITGGFSADIAFIEF